jgi:hypothetical protein
MKIPSFLRPVVSRGEVATERKLKAFGAEIDAAAAAGDAPRLESLLGRPAQLGLGDEDSALEVERLTGLLEALALRRRLAEGQPLDLVATAHRAVSGEDCYFLAPASFPDGLMDQGGKLFVTSKRIVYLGSSPRSAAWADVAEVRDHERDVILTVRPLDLLRFRCNSYVDTLRVAELARHLSGQANASRTK